MTQITQDVERTLIVPLALRDMAQAWCSLLAGEAAEGMFSRECAPASTPTVSTAAIAAGPISVTFADLLPCTSYTTDANGESVATTRPGDVATVVALAASKGLPLSTEQVAGMFAAIYVTDENPYSALARLDLVLTITAQEEI